MTSSATHPVEILDQNRQPLTDGVLEIVGTEGLLKPAKPLIEGAYFLRFTGGGQRSTRVHAAGSDGKMRVESRDYPYKLEVA